MAELKDKPSDDTPKPENPFIFIGQLARRAATGDETARLELKMLEEQQLAEIENLELELQIQTIRGIVRETVKFMPLPEKSSE